MNVIGLIKIVDLITALESCFGCFIVFYNIDLVCLVVVDLMRSDIGDEEEKNSK